jgi:hypothetical protein
LQLIANGGKNKMSLDSKWMKQLEEFLIKKGYTKLDRGLIVYGGKNNGTVDLKATNETSNESIIIEIKNNPIHLIDLSSYLELKRNVQAHESQEKLKFFLITCEYDISSEIKKLAKKEEIIVENLTEFVKRNNF